MTARARLLLTEIFPPAHGGSARWLLELLRRTTHAPWIVVAGEHPAAAETDRELGHLIRRLPLASARFALPTLLKNEWPLVAAIRRLVREHDVGTIYTARLLPEGVLAAAVRRLGPLPQRAQPQHQRSYQRLRCVSFAHGEEVKLPGPGDQGGVMSSRLYRQLARGALGSMSAVIANSQNTQAILADEWGFRGPMHVLYPGVDTSWLTPADPSVAARAQLGWPADDLIVLTVGRLQARKGHDMMLRALPAIARQHPRVRYVIAGDGEERQRLAELGSSLGVAGRVSFQGAVDDATLRACYQQCDLFVLPNRQIGTDLEGFGMVLLEAAACGRAVVAGASGGTREAMQPGVTGEWVDCTTPEPLAECVNALLADTPRRYAMGAAGLHWVRKTFDFAVLARQADALFTSIEQSGQS